MQKEEWNGLSPNGGVRVAPSRIAKKQNASEQAFPGQHVDSIARIAEHEISKVFSGRFPDGVIAGQIGIHIDHHGQHRNKYPEDDGRSRSPPTPITSTHPPFVQLQVVFPKAPKGKDKRQNERYRNPHAVSLEVFPTQAPSQLALEIHSNDKWDGRRQQPQQRENGQLSLLPCQNNTKGTQRDTAMLNEAVGCHNQRMACDGVKFPDKNPIHANQAENPEFSSPKLLGRVV